MSTTRINGHECEAEWAPGPPGRIIVQVKCSDGETRSGAIGEPGEAEPRDAAAGEAIDPHDEVRAVLQVMMNRLRHESLTVDGRALRLCPSEHCLVSVPWVNGTAEGRPTCRCGHAVDF